MTWLSLDLQRSEDNREEAKIERLLRTEAATLNLDRSFGENSWALIGEEVIWQHQDQHSRKVGQ